MDCTNIHTEPIHPIELFEKFRVESLGERPYNHNYGKYEVVTDQDKKKESVPKRELFSKNAKPDSPILACSAQSWAPFTAGGIKSNYGVLIPSTYTPPVLPSTDDQTSFLAELSVLDGGCIEYSKDFSGSFNFNYDATNKRAITQSLPLGGASVTGVTCDGCYAYLGAGFLLIFEYTKGSSPKISAEGKIAGAAGFNAVVNIVNPSISGSSTLTLVKADTTFTAVSLGSGLTFEYKFGGLTALMTGSGSATGTSNNPSILWQIMSF